MMPMQLYNYNKDEIKNSLTINDIYSLLQEWHAEPKIINDETIVARTIDHNYISDSSASMKLYYYDNTKLFVSYTGSEKSFDIFSLIVKIKNREENLEWDLPQAVHYLAQRLGIAPTDNSEFLNLESLPDFKYLQNLEKNEIDIKSISFIQLKEYDDKILKHLPRPRLEIWLKDNIVQEVMDFHNICYDPKNNGIVIPHYDMNGRLIGIRERLLEQEKIELYGKYRPAFLNGQMYNHQLSFNLYNLNNSKENIRRYKKAMLGEAEKFTLQYSSYFGAENDISVAICGKTPLLYHVWLLLQCGAEEIVIALDKDYQVKGDESHKKLCQHLRGIHKKFGGLVKISFLFDTGDLLGYKDSPTDKGKEVFLELYKNKIDLYKE